MAKSASPLPWLRKVCLALPGTSEKLSHGEPTWWVRGRMFVSFANASNHHGNGRHSAWVKAPDGAQRALVEADPERYFVPPYVGVSGWVGARLDGDTDWHAVAGIIEDGYRLLASKRLLAELEGRSA
jgi:hypothetical protein